MTQPFFIVGMPRSGTSLLRLCLNAHPLLGAPDETHYFNRFWRREKNDEKLTANRQRGLKLAEKFLAHTRVMMNDFDEEDLKAIHQKIIQSPQITHPVIFEAMMHYYIQKVGKQTWGEKTPAHLFFIDPIKKYYPQAKIIHIVRDPRDVSLSWINSSFNRGNTVYHALRWRISMATGKKLSEKYKNDYLEIKYEELLTQPEETLKKVCTFINVTYDPKMKDSHQFNQRYDQHKNHHKLTQPIQTSNYNKWKKKMSPQDARVFDVIIGQTLVDKGYEKSSQSPAILFLPILFLKTVQNFFNLFSWQTKHIMKRLNKRKVLNKFVPN